MTKKPERRTPRQRLDDAIDKSIKDRETIVGLIMTCNQAVRQLTIAAEIIGVAKMRATERMLRNEICAIVKDIAPARKEYMPPPDGDEVPF